MRTLETSCVQLTLKMGQTASALNEDDVQSLSNVQFYTCKISSKPDGGKIDNIHQNWFGDWDLLEAHHVCIMLVLFNNY